MSGQGSVMWKSPGKVQPDLAGATLPPGASVSLPVEWE